MSHGRGGGQGWLWWGDGTGLHRWSLFLTNWRGMETLSVSSTTLSIMDHLSVLPPRSSVTPPPPWYEDTEARLCNALAQSSHRKQPAPIPRMLIAYLTSELPGEVLGLIFAIRINFQPLPWPGTWPLAATLLAAAHHMLCLAGCTYTGRIFYNNETFPSVLDPCLSCICLVCTTQPDPNPQHQLLNSREGSPLVLMEGNHLPAAYLSATCLPAASDQGII